MKPLEMAMVRREFPALTNDFIYLDNAGGSQVLSRVADRVRDYLLTSSVQTGASYSHSLTASARVLEARRSVATLINAPQDDEVVMGGSTTALIFQLVQAILPQISQGDEIILTNTDHEANIGAWHRLQQAGAIIRFWNFNPDSLDLELGELKRLISPRTKWIAMTYASNVLGTINPVAEVAKLAKAVGAKVCVDAVAYAPHRLVDVQASGADVLVFSFYKVFGPHYAVMWIERGLLLSLASLNHYFIGQENIPYKLQPGNVNYELSYGCMGIGEYLQAIGSALGAIGTPRQLMQTAFQAFERHEDALAEILLSYLRQKTGVRIIGKSACQGGDRVPTISFVVKDTMSDAMVRQMDTVNIGIRHGDFYAKRLVDALGLQSLGGVVRVSIAHYNTLAEMNTLVRYLDQAIDHAIKGTD